jgi:hypothetical protein
MRPGADDVQYFVVPDATHPHLLARVRWPDVFEAISPVRPDWQVDPGLFDLPYDSTSSRVTLEQAAAIAAEWGAELCADGADDAPKTQLMRRMPANWSDLSRAEKRAWSIEFMKPAKKPNGNERSRRQRLDPALDPSEILHEELITDFDLRDDVIDLTDDVIDLTDERVVASIEDA